MPLLETTLSIIKPDAVRRNLIGKVISCLEEAGLSIVAQKMVTLSLSQVKEFYSEHEGKSFFEDLIKFSTSGPVVIQILAAKNAVVLNRKIMGATNPNEAALGTIRRSFGISIEQNTIHGSDSLFSATREIEFFFSKIEIYNR